MIFLYLYLLPEYNAYQIEYMTELILRDEPLSLMLFLIPFVVFPKSVKNSFSISSIRITLLLRFLSSFH